MEFRDMNTDELLERKSVIAEEVEAEGADLDALETEVRGINEELEARKAEEAKRAEIREAVANEEIPVETIAEPIQEEREEMSNIEIRNTAEYIDAFAEYIKSGSDEECRALLSENASGGTVPVPEIVYDIVKHAWEKEGIISRVRKAFIKGNLKIGFEISGSPATKHTEGVAVDEETLVLGTVELVPIAIKKWVSISDEALDLSGEEFLRYIYDELAYRIAKKAADELVADIIACGTASTTTCPGVPKVTQASIAMGSIAAAVAQLSDEAANPVIMMNKLTWGAFKSVAATNSIGYDPFEGLPVVFNNTIKAFSAASTGDTYVIVGDLEQGALANFPAGQEIKFKFDDMTLATSDLVRVIGRMHVGLGVIAPDAFVKIVK